MNITRVRTFYPADPVGIVPGGIDTFIRGIIKWAPRDLEFSLVGMTTDQIARPTGRWTTIHVGDREFDFFPVVRVASAGRRSRVPLSVRYTASAAVNLRELRRNFDVFDFHRIEPALLFGLDDRPKNAFFHQDMAVIRTEHSDIIWRHFPAVYETLERRIVKGLSSIWCVREEGVDSLKARYPGQAHTIRFVPTWVDEEVFAPMNEDSRRGERARIADELRLNPTDEWVVSVGRLDRQKDPHLLLSSFARIAAAGRNAVLLLIGDGVLRSSLEKRVADEHLSDRVRFLGLRPADEIARVLGASDVFALSSAYEGMPMALLEALGSGLPVATTDVGEVRRVVREGHNGAISVDRSVEAFSECLGAVLQHARLWRGDPALQAVSTFRPSEVLRPVYDCYREIHAASRAK